MTYVRALKPLTVRWKPHTRISSGRRLLSLSTNSPGVGHPGGSVIILSDTLSTFPTVSKIHQATMKKIRAKTYTFPAALTPASVRAALERSTFLGSTELSLEIAPALQRALNITISMVFVEFTLSVSWL